jgi:hypothetical protein
MGILEKIEITIEGPQAMMAAEELMALAMFEGIHAAVEERYRDGGTLGAIATVVGILGGSLTAAEQLRKWYQEGRQGQKIEKVVVIRGETRLELEQATVEEVAAVLKELE